MDNNIDQLEALAKDLLSSGGITHGLGRSLRLLLKEINLYKNHLEGKQLLDTVPGRHENVQIGGGQHTLAGFLNIDIVPPADFVYDVREGIPLDPDSVSFIFSEHFFEHIDYPISAKKFIGECYRILKKGGKLAIGVPDSELVLAAYVKKDKKFWEEMLSRWYSKRDCLEHFNTYIDLVNYHFRDQDDDPKYNPHFWGYDYEKLESLLNSVGFNQVKRWKFDSQIANPKREWGSIYIEAVK